MERSGTTSRFAPVRGIFFLLIVAVTVIVIDLVGWSPFEPGSLATAVSTVLRLGAVVAMLIGLRRYGDLRFAVLALVFGLMAVRQVLTVGQVVGVFPPELPSLAVELPGHVVSVLGLLAAMHLLDVFQASEQRENLERALAVESRRREYMFDHSTAVKLLIDPTSGRIVEANGAASDFYGWSRDELVGLHIQQINCLSEEEVRAEMERARSGHKRAFQFRHRVRNGTIHDVEVHSCAIEVDGRELLFSIVFDVTARTEAEESKRRLVAALEEQSRELARARHQAEIANRNKSTFLANMSHEIRTPMTAVIGFAEALKDPGLTQEERTDAIDTILDSGNYLVELVNQILDLAKVEAGKIELETRAIATGELAAGLAALLTRRAEEKGLELRFEVDGRFPARFVSDPLKLRQILVNLIGNAIKFTETGSIVVRLTHDEVSEVVRFDVVDTGVGMDEHDLERIFEPFEQAFDEERRHLQGTGLGLPISRRFAEAMGGDLTATSIPGEGSTFVLRLPTPIPRDTGWLSEGEIVTLHHHDEEPASGRRVFLNGNVLVADDVQTNQVLVRRILENAGLTVTTVGNGQEAVDTARAAADDGTPFDLVLMDVQMPIMDGLRATEILAEELPDLPVVALTAGVTRDEMDALEAAGIKGCLGKPLQRDELLATVGKWCGEIHLAVPRTRPRVSPVV